MQKTFLGVLILLLFSCILSLTFWFFTPATINFDEEDPFALDLDEVRNLSGQNSILWVDARSEEEFINESETEFAYVNALFSKIRHNRIGYVTGELEKGCDPSIRVSPQLLVCIL